ncbi:protein kinase [candidate division KSB1 bacterium]|nr:protein kinase [candidate division KSB1 bacterium]
MRLHEWRQCFARVINYRIYGRNLIFINAMNHHHFKIILTILFLFIFGMRVASQQADSKSNAAIDSLLQVAATSPTAQVYFELGQACFSAERYDDAQNAFVRCIQSDVHSPFRTQAHLCIGKIYYLTGEYPRAVVEIRKALAREPQLEAAQNMLLAAENMISAEAAFAENDYLKAELHYQTVIKADAENQLARERLKLIKNQALAENLIRHAQEALVEQNYEKCSMYLDDAGQLWSGHPQLADLKRQLGAAKRADSSSRTEIVPQQVSTPERPRISPKPKKQDSTDTKMAGEKRASLAPDSAGGDSFESNAPITEDSDATLSPAAATPKGRWIAVGALFIVALILLVAVRARIASKRDSGTGEVEIGATGIPEKTAKNSSPSESGPCRFIGKYKIIENLTEGGMGRVARARHPHFQKSVVIKSILPELTVIPSLRSRLIREASILFELDHPNIVRVYDLLEEGDQVYIVMQFIEGKNFREILETDGPLEAPRAVAQFIQICEALEYLHQRKIVHRDIKPPNIMLERETGMIKLVDFGIVKPIDREVSQVLTSESRIVGTPNYMSPEQLLNDEIDHRTDIFSLGIVFFEILTGAHPFGDFGISITRAILEKDAPLLSALAPDVNKIFDGVLKKMLEKNVTQRYQAVQAIISDLLRLQERES